jgi:hypothetical protein
MAGVGLRCNGGGISGVARMATDSRRQAKLRRMWQLRERPRGEYVSDALAARVARLVAAAKRSAQGRGAALNVGMALDVSSG